MNNKELSLAIEKACQQQLKLQSAEGYWWYTLEATEYISAEYIFLTHFLGEPDLELETGLIRRILQKQRTDGTWALYYGGKADISTTIECYWALKLHILHGGDKIPNAFKNEIETAMERSKAFILKAGGITHARVFTKIHMALFGLVPWEACPAMPAGLIFMPTWSPVNIYEFSSWARACIVPLLVIMNKRPTRAFPKGFDLEELFVEEPFERKWGYKSDKSFLSWEKFFINMDKVLKLTNRLPISPLDGPAMKKCDEWICEHIERTEDIFPALAYGAMALSALGHSNSHPIIRKAMKALRSFQQVYEGDDLSAVPVNSSNAQMFKHSNTLAIHQQCCISPVWDTPWQMSALLDSGVPSDDQRLVKAGKWLISKQITGMYGDWKFKNPNVKPGGWSFEFENDYFPDVDDTIQVLHVLNRLAIPKEEKNHAIELGIDWLLAMQNDDGGWGAFDKNQKLEVVNKIPFSDHGACLDPSSPDITGRMIWLLSQFKDIDAKPIIEKALDYLERTQEDSGAWSGRWGVNYIYGTWCVVNGLASLKSLNDDWKARLQKALDWLMSIQHNDGGFSESPESYRTKEYIPYPRNSEHKGVPSQTAWALMGMVAGKPFYKDIGGAIEKAASFLLNDLHEDGTWNEKEYTGTGFPNHFYIRYHGYRHFFPLLALARYKGSM